MRINTHKALNWYANLVKPKPGAPPYQHIVQIGDPTLRLKAEPVDASSVNSEEIQGLIKRMRDVFQKYNCVGLAAPQLGVSLRLIAVGINREVLNDFSKEEIVSREMQEQPFTMIINPEVTITDYKKVVFPESCESFRGFWADVTRYRALEIKGLDEKGEKTHLSAKGWLSRIIQHEMDHLDGKLYTDFMDRKSLTCGCWDVINERNGKVSITYGRH